MAFRSQPLPEAALTNEPGLLLAVDIGGTFTDLLLLDPAREQSHVGKVLTTADPAAGVLHGTAALLAQAEVAPGAVARVIHGTTLVTNALIERRGARTALLTTAGFRDALEIGTEGRYDIYDLGLVKPEPLVERRLRFEVPERMNAAGAVLRPLAVAALERICAALRHEDVAAVAVCYLHGYANPAHEVATAEVLRERLPGLPVTLSHRVAPALREYQRTSTTVANAYVQPLAAGYLRRLQEGFGAAGIEAPLHIMLSNGGTATVDTAADFPIRLVESGPAGGALAGVFWGRHTGHDDVLAFDMGGTTAKAVFAARGELAVTAESEVARVRRFRRGSGLPLLVPAVQMIEIGAGGGSIARLGPLGLPTVGPDSAGSEPGPACYGRGGREPTVTDADLLLGYLDPLSFAGGSMTLDPDCSPRGPSTSWPRPCGWIRCGWPGASMNWSTRTWRPPRACTPPNAGSIRGAIPWWPPAARGRCTPAAWPAAWDWAAWSFPRWRASDRPSACCWRRSPST